MNNWKFNSLWFAILGTSIDNVWGSVFMVSIALILGILGINEDNEKNAQARSADNDGVDKK